VSVRNKIDRLGKEKNLLFVNKKKQKNFVNLDWNALSKDDAYEAN